MGHLIQVSCKNLLLLLPGNLFYIATAMQMWFWWDVVNVINFVVSRLAFFAAPVVYCRNPSHSLNAVICIRFYDGIEVDVAKGKARDFVEKYATTNVENAEAKRMLAIVCFDTDAKI